MVLRECLSHSGTELVLHYFSSSSYFTYPLFYLDKFQNSSDEKSIIVPSHGASYLKSLYVLSTHSHCTALQFCLKKVRKFPQKSKCSSWYALVLYGLL